MTYQFKVKMTFNDEEPIWRYVQLDSLPRSCGCDGTLEEFIKWELDEDFSPLPTDRIEIIAFRQLKNYSKVGTRNLYLVHNHRDYGGPEEGCWYYTTQEIVKTFEIPARNYHRHLARLQRYCDAYNKDIKSWNYSQKLHVTGYKQERKERPHYC